MTGRAQSERWRGLVSRAVMAGIVVTSAAALHGQTTSAPSTATPRPARDGLDARPAFDIASVKPNRSDAPRGGALQAGRIAQTNVSLRQLVGLAYDSQQISGGPAWFDSERFDVDARGAFGMDAYLPGRDGSPPAVYLMLQRLLEERFALAVHVERKDEPTYALVPATGDGRRGSQLEPSDTDCDALTAETLRTGRPPMPRQPAGMPPCARRVAPGSLAADSITMAQLAASLSTAANRLVVDRTGLDGRFNVTLTWNAGPLTAVPGAAGDETPASLVTALREQLGLKLESTRAPIDVLVIDRAQRPTPN